MPKKPVNLDEVVTLIYQLVAKHHGWGKGKDKYVIADRNNESIGLRPVDKLLTKALAETKRFKVKGVKTEAVKKKYKNPRRNNKLTKPRRAWGLPETNPQLYVRRLDIKEPYDDWGDWKRAINLEDVTKCQETFKQTAVEHKDLDADTMFNSAIDPDFPNLILYRYDYGKQENTKERIVVALQDMEHVYEKNLNKKQFSLTVGFCDDTIPE